MCRITFIFCLSVGFFAGSSQKQNINWCFGFKCGLKFSTTPASTFTTAVGLSSNPSTSMISDENGNLLFYTDASTVWTANNSTMANGTGLTGGTYAYHSVLVVRQPGSKTKFYIFGAGGGSNGFCYSIVDMSLSSGQGSVTTKNVTITNNPISYAVSATSHCNGVDVWVIVHEANNNNFRSYLLTSAGLATNPVISSVGMNCGTPSQNIAMDISPSGVKLALNIAPNNNNTESDLQVFDFNLSTGQVSKPLWLLQTLESIQSVCFSYDGSKIYALENKNTGLFLHQWDICSGDSLMIASSHYTVSFASAGCLQLAINKRIYFRATPSAGAFNVINFPDLSPANYSLSLSSQSSGMYNPSTALPSYVKSYKNTYSSFSYGTAKAGGCHAISFTSAPFPTVSCASSNYSITGIKWDFGDPSSGAVNNSNSFFATHAYPNAGTYTVSEIFFYACSSDTIRQIVNVPPPSVSYTTNAGCGNNGSAFVSLTGGIGPTSYTWLPSGQNTSFANQLSNGVYTVLCYDSGLSCSIVLTLQISNSPQPTLVIQPSSVSICAGKSATISAFSNGTVQSWTPSTGISQLTATTLAVYPLSTSVYSVVAKLGPCAITTTFFVAVKSSPTLSVNSDRNRACSGSVVTFTGSGGSSYVWNISGVGSFSQNPVSAPVTDNSFGSFHMTLIAADSTGCSASRDVSIAITPGPTGKFPDFQRVVCEGYCAYWPFESIGNSHISTSWNFQNRTSQGSFAFCFSSAGDYTIAGNLYDSLTTCSSAVQSVVTVYPKPFGTFTWIPDKPIEKLEDVNFAVVEPKSYLYYEWFILQSNTVLSVRGTSLQHSFYDAGKFPVVLITTDQNGCMDTVVKIIEVDPPYAVYVPDAFSPNGDERNDVFQPVVTGANGYSLSIFDRWGHQIFETTNTGSWDGTSNRKECQEGEYIWILEVRVAGERTETRTGSVLLYR